MSFTINPTDAPAGHEVRSLPLKGRETPSFSPEAFANWKLREIHEFCRKQWIFLCPVFDEAKFIYWFPKEQRLPFMPAEGIGKDAGHLGVVEKLRIHPAHYQQGSSVCFVSELHLGILR